MIWLIPIFFFLIGAKSISLLLFVTLFMYKTRSPVSRTDDLSPEESFNGRSRLSQLMQLREQLVQSSTPPEIKLENSNPIITRIAGVSHCNEDGESRQLILKKLTTNDPIELVRDPENSYGKAAVKVVSNRGCLGYLPNEIAEKLQLMNSEALAAKILSIGAAKNGLLGCRIALKIALPASHEVTSAKVKPDVIPTNEQQQTRTIEITNIVPNASTIERVVITNHLKLIRQSIVDEDFQVAIDRAQKLHTRFQLEPKLLDFVSRIEINHFQDAISNIDEYISDRPVITAVTALLPMMENATVEISQPIILVRGGLSVQANRNVINNNDLDLAHKKDNLVTQLKFGTLFHMQLMAVYDNRHRYGFSIDELKLLQLAISNSFSNRSLPGHWLKSSVTNRSNATIVIMENKLDFKPILFLPENENDPDEDYGWYEWYNSSRDSWDVWGRAGKSIVGKEYFLSEIESAMLALRNENN